MLGLKGYAFIGSTGYDPEKGKSINDPYFGTPPSLGACMPNIRRLVIPGDHIFFITGKVPNAQQYIVGGFEVAAKMHATVAYDLFPEQRLRLSDGGQRIGNVIVDASGNQHHLDVDIHDPSSFGRRAENYVVGRNPIALTTSEEIARGREETLYVLRRILRKSGDSPFKMFGRWCKLDAYQIRELRDWLRSLKSTSLAMDP